VAALGIEREQRRQGVRIRSLRLSLGITDGRGRGQCKRFPVGLPSRCIFREKKHLQPKQLTCCRANGSWKALDLRCLSMAAEFMIGRRRGSSPLTAGLNPGPTGVQWWGSGAPHLLLMVGSKAAWPGISTSKTKNSMDLNMFRFFYSVMLISS
jgi:hypothetical protein